MSAVYGVDATGKPVLVRPYVPRAKLLELMTTLSPCLPSMEVCSGAQRSAALVVAYGLVPKVSEVTACGSEMRH